MQDRRRFLKKAGLVGGLATAGVLSVKKDYVKPVVSLLEPGVVYAQTPALVVTSASWSTGDDDQTIARVTLGLEVPGGGPPLPGQTFNAAVSIVNVYEAGSGWGSTLGNPLNEGESRTSNEIDNVAVSDSSGEVRFDLAIYAATLNGEPIPQLPDDVPEAITSFWEIGATGNVAGFCIIVSADEGVTTNGISYPAQALWAGCMNLYHE